MKATVIAPEYCRVRAAASLSAPVIGKLDRGAAVDVLARITAADKSTWAVVALNAGGVPLYTEGASPPAQAVGYMASTLLRFDVLPPVPAVRKQRLGIHILNPAAEHSGQFAERAFQMGCRVFTVIDDEVYAQNLADRGARVFFRWWVGNWAITPANLAGRVAGFCKHPNIVTLGLNEGDVTGCFTAAQMEARGKWDTEAYQRISDLGGKYAGLGCAVGNPEFNDPRVCEVVNKYYAPLWKAGIRLNYHAYSPSRTRWFAEGDRDWYEGRWRMLFTRCGLDASNPAGSEIISDEAGMDQDGGGGFAWANVDAAQLRGWCALHYQWQHAPVVVDGRGYTSPYTDATIYQASESQKWAGYNVAQRLEGIAWGG